jgi:hypothetical protein
MLAASAPDVRVTPPNYTAPAAHGLMGGLSSVEITSEISGANDIAKQDCVACWATLAQRRDSFHRRTAAESRGVGREARREGKSNTKGRPLL